ncbi:MAG TPA: TraM recognition domain-containing protein [Candidatus Paceibacterota bacterium]|nr:TraM recognition domain-containing protein [Candidatus Paceibacterota bacterium]
MEKQFGSPQEEIAWLRSKIAEQPVQKREEIPLVIEKEIDAYKKAPHSILAKGHAMIEPEIAARSFGVHEAGRDGLDELISVFENRGLKNALSVVERLENPHLEDQFHQYLVERFIEDGVMKKSLEKPAQHMLGMALFEVSLPGFQAKGETAKPLKEILSTMEQFFAGMMSIASKGHEDDIFAVELANPHGTSEAIFYTAVPRPHADLFEKQLLSIYPGARITPVPQDYNIFNPQGSVVGGYGTSSKNPVFPIKTYEQFDHDPLNVLLNTFAKLDADHEGASVQFIIKPGKNGYQKMYQGAIKQIEKGVPVSYATDIKDTAKGDLWKGLKEFILPPKHLTKKKEDSEHKTEKSKNTLEDQAAQRAIEQINAKVGSPIVLTNIRIVASAGTEERAEHIYKDLESAFHQFSNTFGNGISFKRAKSGKLQDLEREYIFRTFSFEERFPLSLKELTSVIHYADKHIQSAPHLKTAKAGTAPAPMLMSDDGVTLGVNNHRGMENVVKMSREDRMRHMYVIGQTGTGKSTLIKNMAIQDIQNSDGVCFIDPHGVDIQDILASVPKERYDDVIYFDPSYTPRPMALNMLEYDPRFPEQKTFVVNEMLSIFNKLFDMKTAGGPMFEQYFRNATMLVIEDPETGSTLFDVSRVLSDKQYRALKLSRCKNPIVVQFWKEVAEKAGGESSLANMVPYITSKFDIFLSNDIMRPIVSRERSTFDFRQLMDDKKILLVNLAKGKLGDINSNLIGLIIVGKILMAALSRVDSVGKKIPDFYLYVDEFQNVTTPSIATILSEARKYRLSLTVAHQFIAQLEDEIKDAVFGNVGSIAAFRVGADDAEYLAKQFEPVFSAQDLMNVDNRNAYLKMLINGQPARPFNIETLPPPQTHPEILEQLKQLSYAAYGTPREEIEAEIMKKYQKVEVKPEISTAL